MTTLKFGVVDVVDAEGMVLAAHFGALDMGLPTVMIFDTASGIGTPIVAGAPMERKALLDSILQITAALSRREPDGMMMKRGRHAQGGNRRVHRRDL